jgi:hypothetical protein
MSDSESFVPSPPKGATDEPDSPIVQEDDAASTAGPRAPESSQCVYAGQAYGEGANICMTGSVYYCSNGRWVYTPRTC